MVGMGEQEVTRGREVRVPPGVKKTPIYHTVGFLNTGI